MGPYSIHVLYGYTEAVRAVFLLASAKLVFTSGYESVVRMWDMEDRLSIASSQPLGCAFRSVAADTKLLVAGATDGFIHGWNAAVGLPHLFDIRDGQDKNAQFCLWEHVGPIASPSLDLTRIYSGSWDMTVRVWDCFSLKCLKILRHSDWVWGLVPCDTTIASSSSSDVYVWDTSSGDLMTVISNVHVGNTCSLEAMLVILFLLVEKILQSIMFAIIETNTLEVATWIPRSGLVYSLAFEFPWLVSASSDGKMSLIDVRKLRKARKDQARRRVSRMKQTDKCSVKPLQRMLHGFVSSLFSVVIAADRIVCGGDKGVVRMCNFSQALEIEQRVCARSGIRLENRMRRRKLQPEINNNSKDGCNYQCSVAAKKNSANGRNGVWYSKRGMSSKLKA